MFWLAGGALGLAGGGGGAQVQLLCEARRIARQEAELAQVPRVHAADAVLAVVELRSIKADVKACTGV